MKNKKDYFLPFTLMFLIILIDQITKILVVKYMQPYAIFTSFFGDFLNLTLVYNMGAAFSMGAGFASISRLFFLILLPLIFLIVLIVFYFKETTYTKAQRWFMCGILGGGFGNIIDRIFRADGVVDFIDIKFYGLFGMERWPTFNIADSAITCCGVALAISVIIQVINEKKKAKSSEEV